MPNQITMSAPDITLKEVEEVKKVLNSSSLSLGPRTERFEKEFSSFIGTRFAATVSSGTAGLHLSMILADVQEGDYVVTTPFSFIASANCILYQRGIPIFVDIDPDTGNIDPIRAAEAIRELSGERSSKKRLLPPALRDTPCRRASDMGALKAVLVVHLFGQPCDLALILSEARRSKIKLIEDACEAIGAQYQSRNVGCFGDAAVFAFYPNKQMTTGEGGMIVYNHKKWDVLVRSLRNQGRDVFDAWLNHSRLGFNYRMDEMSAAFGLIQLERIENLLFKRSRVAQWYNELIDTIPGVYSISLSPTTSKMSWFVYTVRLSEEYDRKRLISELDKLGIPSRPYFTSIHLQDFYRKQYGYQPGDFPNAEAAARTCLALPFHGNMTEDEVEMVCDSLKSAIQKLSPRKGNQIFIPPRKQRATI